MARRISKRDEPIVGESDEKAGDYKGHETDGDAAKESQWDDECAVFILKQSVLSRCLLFIIQLAFNALVTDFPTDAFKGIPVPEEELSLVDRCIQFALSGLSRWDAMHFLHIMRYGYTYENTLAFFPLFPTVIYYSTIVWSWATPFIHFTTALMLTAVTVNFLCFLLCAQLLYALVLAITKSAKVSLLACLVLTLNPASIFFSAIYSEALFMLLTLCGLMMLYMDPTLPFIRHVIASFFFALAFATRSNGLLNFGYIAFSLFAETVYCPSERKFLWRRDCGTIILKVLRFVLVGFICWTILSSMVIWHGARMQRAFCSGDSFKVFPQSVIAFANEHSLVLPHRLDNLTWCRNERIVLNPMPTFYAPIQRKYWDVKPFGYWKLKKLPCFIMAAPAFIIVLYGCLQQVYVLRSSGSFSGMLSALFDPLSTVPFAVHAVVLSVSALMLYNVEVATRILFSSCPFTYLVLAGYMDRRTPLVTLDDLQYPPLLPFFTNFSRTHFIHALLLAYLLGYFFIGTVLHVNWLPFT
ncbi:GPI mannosyltransferase 2 [Toxocara canis]|uniref:GPI mannosyltransferase 2 n=1 Tax=Toxocara canis TaxID=6265 RepID=A0A0B2VTA5_TOXCA|nr:GPI mannosyltransferase 2 [Toxocara canis]